MGAAQRGGRKIDTARLIRLVAQGRTTRQIADSFGVLPPAVIRACHAANISLPGTISADLPPKHASDDLASASTPPVPLTREEQQHAALVATGGRHSDLAAWAGVAGVSLTQARIMWSRLRLPLSVERTR